MLSHAGDYQRFRLHARKLQPIIRTEDEFLPQHTHLQVFPSFFFFHCSLVSIFFTFLFSASIFRYGQRICEGLCSSKRRRCHNPRSPQRYFLLSFSFSFTATWYLMFFFCFFGGVVDLLFTEVNVFFFVCGFPSYELIHEGASTRQVCQFFIYFLHASFW